VRFTWENSAWRERWSWGEFRDAYRASVLYAESAKDTIGRPEALAEGMANYLLGPEKTDTWYAFSLAIRASVVQPDEFQEAYAQESAYRAAQTAMGAGAIISTQAGAASQPSLPDDALVCRGGTCTADRFASGSGVTVESDGTLSGVSVSSAAGKSVKELIVTYPNKQVGVTTVGKVRAAGGAWNHLLWIRILFTAPCVELPLNRLNGYSRPLCQTQIAETLDLKEHK
jgi:hypothetical protein